MGKQIIKEVQKTATTADTTTGEILTQTTETQTTSIGYAVGEPPYIKLYYATQLSLMNLDPHLAEYIIAFVDSGACSQTQNENSELKGHLVVRTSLYDREEVASKLGVTVKRVDQVIKELVDGGVFVPLEYVRQLDTGVEKVVKRRGIYICNPFVIARGSWADIKEIRQEIEFTKGVSRCQIMQNDGNKRTIEIKLPDRFYNAHPDYSLAADAHDRNKLTTTADPQPPHKAKTKTITAVVEDQLELNPATMTVQPPTAKEIKSDKTDSEKPKPKRGRKKKEPDPEIFHDPVHGRMLQLDLDDVMKMRDREEQEEKVKARRKARKEGENHD